MFSSQYVHIHFIHSHAFTHFHTHTHTQGTLVKAVVAGEAAVRPGLGSENRRSGLMAVKSSHY